MHDRANTLILGLSIVVAVAFLSSAIKDFGRSLEKAAQHQPASWPMPSNLQVTLALESGNSPIRIQHQQ